MAQPLETRTATALKSPDFRAAHLQPLIDENREAAQRQRALAAKHRADAIDPLLGVGDRGEAATQAERATRNAVALEAAVERLTAKLTESKAAEKMQAEQDKRTAVIAERDALAEQFRAIVPEAVLALTDLFGRVKANTEALRALRLFSEPDAEALARGTPRDFFEGVNPIDRFVHMRIPVWNGPGRVWPTDEQDEIQRYANLRRAENEQRQRIRDMMAAKEAEWGWYRLRGNHGFNFVSFERRAMPGDPRSLPAKLGSKRAKCFEIKHTEAERLRGLGCTVEPVTAEQAALELAEE